MKGKDYSNGKIYKLVSDETDKIYIGSTCSLLRKRLTGHKEDYKRHKIGKQHYISSYALVKYDDVEIILLEKYPCESKEELLARERYWIEKKKKICVNKRIPTRTMKEYYEENKQQIKEQMKEYYEANKEKLQGKNREYRLNNEQTIKKQRAKYYEENKDSINETKKEKYNCECGSCLRIADKLRHEKTAKHQKYLSEHKI